MEENEVKQGNEWLEVVAGDDLAKRPSVVRCRAKGVAWKVQEVQLGRGDWLNNE